MARRLWRGGEAPDGVPFWLVQELPRHGLVAGLYQADPEAPGGMAERQAPRLCRPHHDFSLHGGPAPCLDAVARLPEDVAELLAFGRAAAAAGLAAPWQTVLPIYPTSPVAGG
jgi:hypothetical protein